MQPYQSACFFLGHLMASLAQDRVRHEPAAHPDPPMNPPHGQLDPHPSHGRPPGEHVLVHAVDERSIEIKQKRRSCEFQVLDRADGRHRRSRDYFFSAKAYRWSAVRTYNVSSAIAGVAA